MPSFHAVLIDETGCEFGATIIAATREDAYDTIAEQYPESQVAQLETPSDAAARQHDIYARLMDEQDGYW